MKASWAAVPPSQVRADAIYPPRDDYAKNQTMHYQLISASLQIQ